MKAIITGEARTSGYDSPESRPTAAAVISWDTVARNEAVPVGSGSLKDTLYRKWNHPYLAEMSS